MVIKFGRFMAGMEGGGEIEILLLFFSVILLVVLFFR